MTNLVYNTLQNSAEKWPDKIAIHDNEKSLTFKELLIEVDTLKAVLLNAKIESKRAVGLISPNNRKSIIGIFAIVACDCTVMPIATHLTSYEINEAIQKAQLNYIVMDSSMNKEISADEFYRDSSHVILNTNFDQEFAPTIENPAFMRFTSGTTGSSKGVIISQKSAIERVDSVNKELKLGIEDTVIWVLPIAYHFVVSILLYVRFGVTISIVENFMPKNILDATKKHNGTLLYCSPMQIRLLSKDKSSEMMPTMHTVISTSAGISKEICLDFKNRFNKEVSQAYGLIEIGLPIINKKKSLTSPESVGFALEDYDVDILDENYTPLPDGEIGLLGMKGPGMFNAYLEPFTPREEVLKNGYFITSDLAIKENGLITIKGRTKSVINISGNKVFPEEVEVVLNRFKGVQSSKVTGVSHPLMGIIVQAEIVLEEGTKIDPEELISFCRQKLSNFKVPQKIKPVDFIELTPTGKIKR